MDINRARMFAGLCVAISKATARARELSDGSIESELDAAGPAELRVFLGLAREARTVAERFASRPAIDRLHVLDQLKAAGARDGFQAAEWRLNEMARDLEAKGQDFAVWIDHGAALLPLARSLEGLVANGPILRHGLDAAEQTLKAEVLSFPDVFVGWTHAQGAQWLAEQGVEISERSLKKSPFWLTLKKPKPNKPRQK